MFFIDYGDIVKDRSLTRSRIKKVLERTYKKVLGKGNIELIFVDSAEIKRINHESRNINKVTDVITLVYKKNPSFLNLKKNRIDGQVFICLPQIKKQALKRNHSFYEELLVVFIHACLHILDYDHVRSKERKVMRIEEDKYLKLLKKNV